MCKFEIERPRDQRRNLGEVLFTSGLTESKTRGTQTRPRHRAKRIKVPQRWQERWRTRYQVKSDNNVRSSLHPE